MAEDTRLVVNGECLGGRVKVIDFRYEPNLYTERYQGIQDDDLTRIPVGLKLENTLGTGQLSFWTNLGRVVKVSMDPADWKSEMDDSGLFKPLDYVSIETGHMKEFRDAIDKAHIQETDDLVSLTMSRKDYLAVRRLVAYWNAYEGTA